MTEPRKEYPLDLPPIVRYEKSPSLDGREALWLGAIFASLGLACVALIGALYGIEWAIVVGLGVITALLLGWWL